jgi:periplasmic divalent cation tolerance protein
MSTEAAIVMTTVGSEAEAEALAGEIVEAHLAACVQILAIRSVYVWKGSLERGPEWLLLAKTRGEHYGALEAFIRERHAYETPEIVMVPITAGSAGYLAWLGAQTQAAPPR